MYTQVELEAFDAADEAFREVKKVADEFARQTRTNYHRNVTSWTSGSHFNVPFAGRSNAWAKVHDLYKGDNNEAIECAWEIERTWNLIISKVIRVRNERQRMAENAETVEEAEYYEGKVTECYDARDMLLDMIGECIERWYDSASDCAYEAYIEEHAA